ncbi:MAG: hypothetical protein H6555_11605, partial [Lewinellaceae bacterium]|nr:hypothetical protein [Lewinellaceae bacterium]
MNLRNILATLLFLFATSFVWSRATTDLAQAIVADTTPQWPLLEMPAFRYTIASPGEWEILPIQEDPDNAEVRVTYDEATGISYLFVARRWPLWGERPSLKEGLERAIEPLLASRSLITEWVDIAPLPEGGSALGAKLAEGGDMYGELRSFIIGPYTYFLGVFQEEGVLTDPSYLHYFDSFRYTPPVAVRWEQIKQQAGAFSVVFPDNYQRSVTQTPFAEEPADNPYEISSLRAIDEENKIDAVVRYDLLPIGYQATDPHARLEAVLTTIEDNLPEATTATDQDWQGYPALRREYDMEHSTIWLQMIQRGNRTYILFIQFAPDQLAQARAFFNSFTLLPFTYGNSLPETQTSPDGVLTLSLPSGTLFSRDTLIEDSYPDWEKLRYLGRDTLSGLDFNVNINRFSPYWSG